MQMKNIERLRDIKVVFVKDDANVLKDVKCLKDRKNFQQMYEN